MRSASVDQPITPTASPIVDADTMSADAAAPVFRLRAISGRTACGEYSCAKVATPAQNNAPSSLR